MISRSIEFYCDFLTIIERRMVVVQIKNKKGLQFFVSLIFTKLLLLGSNQGPSD